jgi:hypothetical protein
MAIQVDNLSRLRFADPIIIDGKETFGLWNRPSWMNIDNVEDKDVQNFVVNQETAGRPDLISNQVYGTPLLEWVVIMFNNPTNTLGFPKTGTTIRLPKPTLVFSNI